MELIIEYFKKALAALLALFGYKLPEMDAELKDNLESMYDNIAGYQPQA